MKDGRLSSQSANQPSTLVACQSLWRYSFVCWLLVRGGVCWFDLFDCERAGESASLCGGVALIDSQELVWAHIVTHAHAAHVQTPRASCALHPNL